MEFFLKRQQKSEYSVSSGKVGELPVPEFAVPTEAEKTYLKRAGAWVRLRGTGKRVQMLKDLYDDYTCEIITCREGEQTQGALGMDIAQMERARQEAGLQSREARRKIVLTKPGAEEIWKNFKAGEAMVRKNPSGVLAISLPVALKAPFAPDVPHGIRMVVDGALTGEVWFEDVYVGGVVFPLPLMGIPTDMTGKLVLEGLCGRSVGAEGQYTVKLSRRQNLWLMEV